MAWTTTDIPDQSGKVAVVTGANGEGSERETGVTFDIKPADPASS